MKKALQILEQIKGSKPSAGTSDTYTVYILNDVVVKVFEDKESFELCVHLHRRLDKYDLLPKMITNFYTDTAMYLVVEKIEALFAKEFINGGLGANSPVVYEYDESPEFKQKLEDYLILLKPHRVRCNDTHPGNFGYRNGTFMCLDEDCFIW